MPETVEATTVFVLGAEWSGFVRLTEARRSELEAAGVLVSEDLPEFGLAYRMAEG